MHFQKWDLGRARDFCISRVIRPFFDSGMRSNAFAHAYFAHAYLSPHLFCICIEFYIFPPFKKNEVRMRKIITAHARVKKGEYHLRNTKIPSSRRITFLQKKGITLIYAMWGINLSLFRVDPRGDPNRPTWYLKRQICSNIIMAFFLKLSYSKVRVTHLGRGGHL